MREGEKEGERERWKERERESERKKMTREGERESELEKKFFFSFVPTIILNDRSLHRLSRRRKSESTMGRMKSTRGGEVPRGGGRGGEEWRF